MIGSRSQPGPIISMTIMNSPENTACKKALLNHFSGLVTENRWNLFSRVSSARTRYITVAVENLYQSHNASAVIRSCECFGVQDVHFIENENEYQVNDEIAMGSDKWLDIHRYNASETNTAACLGLLKEQGYRLIATVPRQEAVSIYNFDVTKGKFALLFGTEKEGLSDEALAMADECVYIPMKGFTESFNISVSAALSLFQLTNEVRTKVSWQLSEDELLDLQLDWLRKSIKESEPIEQRFRKRFFRGQDIL